MKYRGLSSYTFCFSRFSNVDFFCCWLLSLWKQKTNLGPSLSSLWMQIKKGWFQFYSEKSIQIFLCAFYTWEGAWVLMMWGIRGNIYSVSPCVITTLSSQVYRVTWLSNRPHLTFGKYIFCPRNSKLHIKRQTFTSVFFITSHNLKLFRAWIMLSRWCDMM